MNTRTSNSIYNILSTIIPYAIIGILGIIKLKIFVNILQADIVSINQLFFQLLSYLALAEAGFGIYSIQKYYKAFAKNDREEINKIFSTSKIFFQRIGFIILVTALILSFFVQFLTKADLFPSYIQIVFMIFIIKNSIDYFMISPRFVIQADQKMYKINYIINLIKILESITEIILVLVGFNYLIILLAGIPIRIILNKVINNRVYKEYSWLKAGKKFFKEHIKGVSDVLVQKIVGVFYSSTDIILISTYINPITVVAYTSYNYIIKFIFDAIFMCAQALGPSYANVLNNENEQDKKYNIFSELNILFFFISSFFAIFLSVVLNQFITLWVGDTYLLSKVGFYMIIGIMYMDIARRMMYLTINCEGLFKETKKIIIIEAILNLIISLICIRFFKIEGVLFGTLLSMTLTTLWYFPKYILKHVFNKNPINYFKDYAISLLVTILLIIIFTNIKIIPMNNLLSWILGCIIYFTLIGIILFVAFALFYKSFRALYQRGLYILKNKKKENI